MFKLMDKKIIAIFRLYFLLNWPYGNVQIKLLFKAQMALFHHSLTYYPTNDGLQIF